MLDEDEGVCACLKSEIDDFDQSWRIQSWMAELHVMRREAPDERALLRSHGSLCTCRRRRILPEEATTV